MSSSTRALLLVLAAFVSAATLTGSCNPAPSSGGVNGNGATPSDEDNTNGTDNGNGEDNANGGDDDTQIEPIDRPDPEIVDPQLLSGKVSLPTDSTLSLSDLRVMTNAETVAIGSDGTFTAKVISTGPTLAPVLDESGNVMLLGFVDPSLGLTEISPKTTAAALMYFALGGAAAPAGALPELLDLILGSSACDTLATTISDTLATEPTALVTGDLWITSGTAAAVDGLSDEVAAAKRIAATAGKRRGAVLQADASTDAFVVLDPLTSQSGVTLTASGGAGFDYRNYFPRRVMLYVLRTAEADATGTTHDVTPPELVGDPVAISGAGELIRTATVAQILNPTSAFEDTSGSVWESASGGPIALTTNAETTSTHFDIIVLGAALDERVPPAPLTDSKYVTFRDEWEQRISEMSTEAFIGGFFLPVVEQYAVGARLFTSTNHESAPTDALRELIEPVLAAGSVSLDTANGYFFAIDTLLDQVNADTAFQEALVDALIDAVDTETGRRLRRDAMLEGLQSLSGVSSLTFAVQQSTHGNDVGRTIRNLKDSSVAETWTADVGKVQIRPSSPTISMESPSVVLRADVAGGNELAGYCYEWENTAVNGTISTDLGEGGTSFVTSESVVQYLAPPANVIEADLDTVTVRVYDRGDAPAEACGAGTGAGDFVGLASVVVRGEEFDENPCQDFPQESYVDSDILSLRISPSVVRPGDQITATVTYDLSHPLAPSSLVRVSVWCSYSCGFCGPGDRCDCSPEEERRTIIDDGADPADLLSMPYVTALGKTPDRAGLRVPCTVQVDMFFSGGPDPDNPAPDTHTFTFTVDDDWAPCPPEEPDCRCPELLDHDPDFISERNIWSGPFVVARAQARQSVDSQITTSETAARVFSFATDPEVNTNNPPECP